MSQIEGRGDNSSIHVWDYNSGTASHTLNGIPQPGLLEAEAGVFCPTFSMTVTHIITGCTDKTIKYLSFPSLISFRTDIC